MATYKQGFLGSFSGKLGNVIGTFWKGISVMRVVPANVTNPNTLAQQAQRNKFKLLSAFLSANAKFFKIGFGAMDKKMSQLNAAMKANFSAAIKGTFPDFSIDTTKLTVSKGQLPGLEGFTAEPGTNAVSLAWTDNSSVAGAAASDTINVAVFDEDTGESVTILQVAERLDEMASVPLPAGWTGKSVSVYAYLVNEDAAFGISSPSQVSDPVSKSGITVG